MSSKKIEYKSPSVLVKYFNYKRIIPYFKYFIYDNEVLP